MSKEKTDFIVRINTNGLTSEEVEEIQKDIKKRTGDNVLFIFDPSGLAEVTALDKDKYIDND